MTTSNRPTWQPAKGTATQSNQYYLPSMSFSARDLPGHLTIKTRKLNKIPTPSSTNPALAQPQPKEHAFSQICPSLRKKIIRPDAFVAVDDPDDAEFIKSEEEEEEDEDQLLLREYQRVKRQKEEGDRDRRRVQMTAVGGVAVGEYSLQKKWYEDTVFRNQAVQEKNGQSYVNDNVRSQFHRKFLRRFIMR